MAIFEKSRYSGSYLFQDDKQENVTFIDPIRVPMIEADKEDYVIQVKQGDRLDLIAKRMYGDERYEWVLMDANPQYSTPLDVKAGDYINVPRPERVSEEIG